MMRFGRAAECAGLGFKAADALHVAAAEALRAGVLLTCDDRMLKAGVRTAKRLQVVIATPLTWLEEQNNDANA
jgi:predicted nucleic acid-binding protein